MPVDLYIGGKEHGSLLSCVTFTLDTTHPFVADLGLQLSFFCARSVVKYYTTLWALSMFILYDYWTELNLLRHLQPLEAE